MKTGTKVALGAAGGLACPVGADGERPRRTDCRTRGPGPTLPGSKLYFCGNHAVCFAQPGPAQMGSSEVLTLQLHVTNQSLKPGGRRAAQPGS